MSACVKVAAYVGVLALVAVGVWLVLRPSDDAPPPAASVPEDAGLVWREPALEEGEGAAGEVPTGLDELAREVEALAGSPSGAPEASEQADPEIPGREGAAVDQAVGGPVRAAPPPRLVLTPEQEAARARGVYLRNVQSLDIANRLLLSIVPEIEVAREAGDAARVQWLERTADRLRTRRDNLQQALEEAGEPPPPPE
ncbi:MAG: hypothetical protein KF901_07420 [Myxococcales bacterium]|nr:hypothetical protein [Myxococcales bacterium]